MLDVLITTTLPYTDIVLCIHELNKDIISSIFPTLHSIPTKLFVKSMPRSLKPSPGSDQDTFGFSF